MNPIDQTASQQAQADSNSDAPDGYDAVAALLRQASSALSSQELSNESWVRVRAAMPDNATRRQPLWRWALLGGGIAAAAAIALAIIPGRPDLTSQAPTAFKGENSTVVASEQHPAIASDAGIVVGQTLTAATGAKRIDAFGRYSMTLEQDARMSVSQWGANTIELSLLEGAVHCDVTPSDSGESRGFTVVAGKTRVSVVGTRFRVAMDDAGMVSVSVERGEVLATRGGVTRTLLAGDVWQESAEAAAGKPATSATVASDPVVSGVQPADTTSAGKSAKSAKSRGARTKGQGRATEVVAPNVVAKAAADSVPKVIEPVAPSAAVVSPEAPKQANPVMGKKTETVEITVKVDDAAAAPVVAGARAMLSGSVGLIRAGRCGAAKAALRKLYHRLDKATPPDLFYLMGYCLHKEGKTASANAFFARYRRMSSSRRFKIPSAQDDIVAVPTRGQLTP